MKIKTKLFYFLVIAAIIATAYLVLKEDTIKNLYIDYSQIQPQSKLYGDRIELYKNNDKLLFVNLSQKTTYKPLSKLEKYETITLDSVFEIFGSNKNHLLERGESNYNVYLINRDTINNRLIFREISPAIEISDDKNDNR